MKFRFIEHARRLHRLAVLCRVLGVSRSGYYRWRRNTAGGRERYRQEALAHIREVFERSHRTYGSPRIHQELRAQGRRHSRRFIGLLMRRYGLRARAAFRRRPASASDRAAPFGNVLARRFESSETNRVWAADLTYIPTARGWLFLAVVLDLASRRVVGWAMGRYCDAALTQRALEMAVTQRRPRPGLLHHCDRGVQYANAGYLQKLADHRMQPSFSRTGDCWDNAVVESFFHTLKTERLRGQPQYPSRESAMRDLVDFIEVWYNRQRRHSSLGYVSPAEFEQRL